MIDQMPLADNHRLVYAPHLFTLKVLKYLTLLWELDVRGYSRDDMHPWKKHLPIAPTA